MIELEGKWLAVWLSLEEVFSIFGFGPLATGSSEVWMIGDQPTEREREEEGNIYQYNFTAKAWVKLVASRPYGERA